MMMIIAFIWRYSPLSSRLTALACDSTYDESTDSAIVDDDDESHILNRLHQRPKFCLHLRR